MAGISSTYSNGLNSYYQNINQYRQNQQQRVTQGLPDGQPIQDQLDQPDETSDQVSISQFAGLMKANDQTGRQIDDLKNPNGSSRDFSTVAADIIQDRRSFQAERISDEVQAGLINPDEQAGPQTDQSQTDALVENVLGSGNLETPEFPQVMGGQNSVSRGIASYMHNQRTAQAATASGPSLSTSV